MQKLLASDFQEASQSAAEAAVLLSQRFGAKVDVIHVLESFPAWRLKPPQHEAAVLEYLASKHAASGLPL